MAAMIVNRSGQNEQSLYRTFYRCYLPSFGSFCQAVSEEKINMWKVNTPQKTDDGRRIPASGFRGEDFRNWPIKNKNWLWWPCLLTDRDEMSIDAYYPVSIHLAKWFQRRRFKCEKLTDDWWRTPSDAKSSLCLWQGELIKRYDETLVDTYMCRPVY